MTSAEPQDTRDPGPRPSQEARGFGSRRRVGWLAFVLWIAYSAALLGWHAVNAPPADACIVR